MNLNCVTYWSLFTSVALAFTTLRKIRLLWITTDKLFLQFHKVFYSTDVCICTLLYSNALGGGYLQPYQ